MHLGHWITTKIRHYSIKKQNAENKRKFPTSILSSSVKYDDFTIFEGENVVNNRVNVSSSQIGRFSVIGDNCDLNHCKIGRFCSIAQRVKVQPWTHPTEFISTYSGFFNTINNYPFGKGKIKFNECLACESGFYAEIGNDVWIGEQVIIRGGIKIGDGAIIGMGAVVTKDVPPYSIVGGIPARVIRYRFDRETINQLLALKWWDWDIDTIKSERDLFCSTEKFLKKFCKED